jgi:hypothetical protein
MQTPGTKTQTKKDMINNQSGEEEEKNKHNFSVNQPSTLHSNNDMNT